MDELVQLAKLHQPNGALEIGHAVVETHHVEVWQQVRTWPTVPLFLGHRRAVVAQHLDTLSQLIVVGRHHPPLTCRDGLAWVEGKDAEIAEPPGGAAVPCCTSRAGCIFDDLDIRPNGCPYRINVGTEPEEMHGNDRLGARGHTPSKILGVNIKGDAIHINEHRRRPAIDHHISSRDPCKGRHDDLVTWTDLQRRKGEMQASCGRSDRDAMLHAVTPRERTLKCSDFRTLRDPTALDRLEHR